MLKFRDSLHGSINYPLLLKSLVLPTFILLASSAIFAQKFSISALTGYQMGGNSDQADIVDDWNYALLLSFPVKEGAHGELIMLAINYSRQVSELKFDTSSQPIEISVEYFHVGALIEKQYRSILPFGLLSAGLTRFDQKGIIDEDEWRISIAIGVGTNIFVSRNIGFRMQSRVLMPLWFSKTHDFLTIPVEEGPIASGIHFLQLDLAVGLTFRL